MGLENQKERGATASPVGGKGNLVSGAMGEEGSKRSSRENPMTVDVFHVVGTQEKEGVNKRGG